MIDILLSTYNGSQYLAEQLDSLFCQTYTDWKLLVRDDGSTDETVEILRSYFDKYPTKIHLYTDGIKHLGAARSFEFLMEKSTAPYVMFCDQDDIWLPQKTTFLLDKIQQLEQQYGQSTPIVVHSDLEVVAENMDVICSSFWQYGNIHPEILDKNVYFLGICNSVTGCASIFNKAAKENALPLSSKALMHDAWVAISTLKNNGIVEYIPQALIKYRQHGKNVLGAVKYRQGSGLKHFFSRNHILYKAAHPFVYKNKLQYWYHRLRYFYVLHFSRLK